MRRRATDGAVRSSGNSPPRSVLVATGVRPNFPSWAGDVQSFDKIGTRCGRPKGLKVGVTNAMNAGDTSLNFEMFDRDAEATHHARKRMRYCARRRAGKLCRLTLRHEHLPNHIQAGNRLPNIGRPLFDSASVASSWSTSQCSARRPSSILTTSAAIRATGRPSPVKRPWRIT